ncbi:MAG: TetR/AcrR family transcriptional regulator [Aquabacterium sp.]|nr:TetR/AcrR family transcriptional regulator [Aquabacterium sp.]
MDKSKNHDGGTGRVYGGESLVDRTARRRQQFLDAGLAIFGTSGYRSATVRMLCKQAQLTDRYFYESFDSAEDLLMAVYLQCIERMQGAVLTELMSAPPSGDIKTVIVRGLDLFFTVVSDARVARVCWLEVLGVSRRVDAMYNDTFNAFAAVGLIFARAQFPAWVLDDEEAQVLSVAVVGAVSQSVTHWLLGDYRESKATMVAATSRVFFGLLATMQEG